MSANVSFIPLSTFHNPNSRSPGVSISSPPPGRRNICRAVVVCLPLLSASRVGFVACFSSRSNRFTSVDFPTPEDPSNTIVFPGDSSVLQRLHSLPRPRTQRNHRHADRDALRLRNTRRDVVALVLLVQHNHRRHSRIPTLRQIPLKPSRTEIHIQSRHQKTPYRRSRR